MSDWVEVHIPCPCGSSSDAYCINGKGDGHCFSCNKHFFNDNNKKVDVETSEFTYEYLPRRGITKETHEFFGVKTQVDKDGVPTSVAYPHPNGAIQIRNLKEKGFYWTGENRSQPGGFFKDKFPAGSSKAITIVEGYDDGMSVWQMLGKHPVYSVKSASSAMSDVRADYEYLNSFEKIYLCLDNDEPGEKATREIASIFGFGKVYHVKNAPLKDANDYLQAKREKEFKNIWWNASRWMPETVISNFIDIEKEFEKRKAVKRFTWPWQSWQKMTGGIEIHRQYLITGLEGTGKTEALHEIAAHFIAQYPDVNIGFIHAEEPVTDTVTLQVGKHLRKPIHLDDHRLKDEDVLQIYKKMVVRSDRVHFFRHFGSEETDALLQTIRFMVAACGCQIILLDNYQHLVTGRTKDRDTEALDYLANRLESLVKELDFSLIAISHENDDEKTRGSRNISKECDVWINIKRDVTHENELIRNMQRVTYKKNRQAGKTGPAGILLYDQSTATLADYNEGELPT